MAYVTIEVEAFEVLDDLTTAELRAELRARETKDAKNAGVGAAFEGVEARRARLLEDIYQHFRNRCPCAALREFISDETGKIL